MTGEAVTTSEIEGEILDRANVQSSIRRELGLATDKRRVKPAEQGIAEMMVDLYRGFAQPLSEEMMSTLSAGNYATITGASPATTTRDLADLVEKGALRRTGERRHARYWVGME
jgi:Fic family protein